jgi:hypothetical protein
MFVKFPTNATEASVHTTEMEIADFSGCIGSIDVSHVTLMHCPIKQSN